MPDSVIPTLFTSESVTEGHPDKLCDAVADAILDDVLEHDPDARCAVEVATTTGLVVVLGEVTTEHYVDVQEVVRRTVRQIGYNDSRLGFDWETCGTMTAIKEQSPDIALGVAHPLAINVQTWGTGTLPDDRLAGVIERVFDLRPGAIIRDLDLRRPIYRQTAAYGHVGRDDLDLPWERVDRIDELRAAAR